MGTCRQLELLNMPLAVYHDRTLDPTALDYEPRASPNRVALQSAFGVHADCRGCIQCGCRQLNKSHDDASGYAAAQVVKSTTLWCTLLTPLSAHTQADTVPGGDSTRRHRDPLPCITHVLRLGKGKHIRRNARSSDSDKSGPVAVRLVQTSHHGQPTALCVKTW